MEENIQYKYVNEKILLPWAQCLALGSNEM